MNCVKKNQLSKSSFPSSSSSYFLGRRVTVSRYIKVTLLAFSDFRLAKASKLHLNTSYLQALFARVLLWLLLSFFAMFWHSTHSFYASRSVYLYCGYRGRFSLFYSGDTVRIISACAWEMTLTCITNWAVEFETHGYLSDREGLTVYANELHCGMCRIQHFEARSILGKKI